ncbi:hypothetical protein R3W88_025288 [Solanum pinnatisectum]|uniref:J domain-containing protein n=1 Tax=Solanum pinnatisectum TaxID=50273 RepID=A0AAV9M5R6_9SOLN|nr:hypothetical protein R3W88_025288 [Solanum pinnatisectum]
MEFVSNNNGGSCYYDVLGICKQASHSEIRCAYRKLALKWHPDRWMKRDPCIRGEAKHRFQQVQEAYSVLSDKRKRSLYDTRLLHLMGDDSDDDKEFCEFMQEMITMMEAEKSKGANTLEELQKLFSDMTSEFDKFSDFSFCFDESLNGNMPKKRRVYQP